MPSITSRRRATAVVCERVRMVRGIPCCRFQMRSARAERLYAGDGFSVGQIRDTAAASRRLRVPTGTNRHRQARPPRHTRCTIRR